MVEEGFSGGLESVICVLDTLSQRWHVEIQMEMGEGSCISILEFNGEIWVENINLWVLQI